MSSYADMTAEILAAEGYDDWEVEDDSVLRCPCGHLVEYDGACPSGHVSPLREVGMI
jgi:hypothetical protein